MGLSLQTNSTFILENGKKWTCLLAKFLHCDARENHSSDRFIGRTSLTFQADFSIIDLKKQTNNTKKLGNFDKI